MRPQPEAPAKPVAPASRITGLAELPSTFVAIDLETTGLNDDDRIVSLSALLVESARLNEKEIDIRCLNLIFDPGKKSDPAAERIHGYDDWILRHQQFFSEKAQDVRGFLERADLVVAHNAEFDLSFLNRELSAAGLKPLSKPSFCTMSAYRRRHNGSASLNAVAGTLGLARAGMQHGSLEDAWLTLQIYLWLHGGPRPMRFSQIPADKTVFTNLQPVPPKPSMARLPRR